VARPARALRQLQRAVAAPSNERRVGVASATSVGVDSERETTASIVAERLNERVQNWPVFDVSETLDR